MGQNDQHRLGYMIKVLLKEEIKNLTAKKRENGNNRGVVVTSSLLVVKYPILLSLWPEIKF